MPSGFTQTSVRVLRASIGGIIRVLVILCTAPVCPALPPVSEVSPANDELI